MPLQSSASDADGKADRNTVFIDTNLDTHLAMLVSNADTVSDLKKRIKVEHPLCFPKIGQIQIHAIKVKRKGYFYHLSDSMLVRSAFIGSNKGWFLSVDGSALIEHEKNQISNSPGSSNQVACCGIANNASIGAIDIPLSCPSKRVSDFNCFELPQLENRRDEKEEAPFVSPCVSEHSGKGVVDNLETCVKPSGNDDTVIPSRDSIPETKDQCCVNYELPSSCVMCEIDGFSKRNKDEGNVCEEGTLKSVPSAKKKRKSIRKKEDTVQDDAFKDKNVSVLGSDKLTVQQGIIVPKNLSKDASREFSYGTIIGENNITDELCWNSNKTSSGVQMLNEAFKETEVPKDHTESKKSMKESSEPGSAANKKHRKRKRYLTQDLKEEMLKVESASQKAEVHKSNKEQKQIEEPKEQAEFNNDKSGDGIEFQHNKVSQEPSDAGSPAKKKQKGKERSGYESALKENISMIIDSNKETLKPEKASQHSLEDLSKIKNSSADQSTDFGDADPARTSVLGSKRKRKKNSSNHHQTGGGTSSRQDDEAGHSRIYGEGGQEEIHKDGQIFKDISVSKIAGDNLEIGTDACKEGTTFKVKRTGNSKDHCAVDMKVHASDVNDAKELTEDNGLSMHENIALDHCHLSEAGQTERAQEGREISPLDDPKHLLSENCTPSNQNNIDVNIRELTVTSEVLEANGTIECGKSRKTKKKRNAKDSDRGPLLAEGFSCADASKSNTVCTESHEATNCDPASGNTETEENLLNQTKGQNAPLEEMKGTYLSATDREVNDINASSLEKISKTEAHAENMSEKKSKESKKKQIPTTKSVSDVLTKDKVLDHKEPSPTSDSRLLVEPSSKKAKKDKSASKKSTSKSSGPILEPERDFIEIEPPHYPSNAPKGKSPLRANDTAIDSTSSFGDEDDNHLEASSKSDKINAEHSACRQQQHKDIVSDDILVDKNGADRTDIELMTGNNRKGLQVMKGNTHTGSLSSTQRLLSKEGDGLGINPRKKVPKVHRTGQEAQLSSQSNSVMSTIEENKRPQVNKSSGKSMNLVKKNEAIPVSNSKLKGLKKMDQSKVGKASGNNIEGVVSKKEQKKSLLAGTIFKDDSSGTSEDEDENFNDSSSSTRGPSDNSLSSDYSDGDSHTGSSGRKGLETGGRSSIKSRSSGTKGMPIDSILRSSSRYKKAKMTASQLEDTESQPVDFVPDSLADT